MTLIQRDTENKLIDIGPPLALVDMVYQGFEAAVHFGMAFSLHWILPERQPISIFTKLMAQNYIAIIAASVMAVFLSLLAAWWVVLHVDIQANFNQALTSTISICLAGPLPYAPTSIKMRVLLICCFGAFIPLDVMFQSFVTSTLTEPYFEPKLLSIFDIAKSDLAMKFQLGLSEYILPGLDNKTRQVINRKSLPSVTLEPEEMAGTNRTAVLVFKQKIWHLRNYEEAETYREVPNILLSICTTGYRYLLIVLAGSPYL